MLRLSVCTHSPLSCSVTAVPDTVPLWLPCRSPSDTGRCCEVSTDLLRADQPQGHHRFSPGPPPPLTGTDGAPLSVPRLGPRGDQPVSGAGSVRPGAGARPPPAEGRPGPAAPGPAAATSAAAGKGPAPGPLWAPRSRRSLSGPRAPRRPQDAAGAEAHLQRVPQHVLLHVEEGRAGRDPVQQLHGPLGAAAPRRLRHHLGGRRPAQ